jgi:hypothetical protein
MPFWMPGTSICPHCGQVLLSEYDVFLLPPAWIPHYEPMTNFRGAAFHRSCWTEWQFRQRFIEIVNGTASGYRFTDDESWSFIDE